VVLFDLTEQTSSGVILEGCVTAEAAAKLTGYNIQHIRRLAWDGKLEALHIGRSWLIKLTSLQNYLEEVVPAGDGRFGPRHASKYDNKA
jgi:excisionase family DNA binding protein